MVKYYEEKCNYCGRNNLKEVEVISGGYHTILCTGFLKEEKLLSIVCLDCGNVVRFFVKNPKKLLSKKDRGDD